MRYRILVTALAVCQFFVTPAWCKDIKGGKDHPLVKRYQGSSITAYELKAFDEYLLVTKPIRKSYHAKDAVDSTNSTALEGKITKIRYFHPPGRSTLEVFRNYETELKSAGFETLYQCKSNDCGGRNFNVVLAERYAGSYLAFGDVPNGQRYLAAKLSRPEGDVYVSLFVVQQYNVGGATKDRINISLDVIELKPMETRMVLVKADEMEKSISERGSVSLYGIYFDFDKAIVKPDSKATLGEIAKLLKKRSSLKLVVVGHTDNKGGFDYNMDLSKRRAQAVHQTLVQQYGIPANRLRHWGVGFLAPVATNQTDAGRSKNRRVELVEE